MTIAMRMAQLSMLGLCVATLPGCSIGAGGSLKTHDLRTEYRENPLGIDSAQPRLSWILSAANPRDRDVNQSAYQILAASARKKLNEKEADLWSTGKVSSDETIQIPYAGRLLESGQECWWTVRVWDEAGKPSDWSAPARFSAGLKPEDWQAKWIGYDAPAPKHAHRGDDVPPANVDGGTWVWPVAGEAVAPKPPGDAFFRKVIELPQGSVVQRAVMIVSIDDSLALFVNGKPAGNASGHTRVSSIDLKDHLKPGKNVVAIQATNGAGPAGVVGRVEIAPAPGEPVVVNIDEKWKTSTAAADGWMTADFDDSSWKPPHALAKVGAAPWGVPGQAGKIELPPPPYLRKVFEVKKPVRRAMVYATALGVYELSLNGERIGNAELQPGWTDYNDRIYYQSYDVTDQVKRGGNVVGAILGDGWYAGYYSYQGKRNLYGEHPRLLAQLVIEHDDGSKEIVATDASWKASYGPIVEADLLHGSSYDARLEVPGWNKAGFDDSKWQSALVGSAPKARIEAQVADPLTRHETLAAKAITEPRPGTYVFDLGQNMVGWVRLKVDAEAGTKITLRHAEMLNPDGTLYLTALRGARATDTYYARGAAGDETWEPPFTFHGFRFVEVTGLDKKPTLDAITGIVVHSEMARTGKFTSSNPLLNQLFHNIIWGQKGNYFDVPFDCPQRDERLGWTGDAQAFIRTGAYNFNVAPFFTKWLTDLIEDSQFPDGSFADVAPDLLGGHGNTAWQDAGIICPYNIYRVYGDTQIIRDHYAGMTRYMEYLKASSIDFVRGQGAYGDWVNLGGGAKSEVIGTTYFAYVARIMSEMSRAIGRVDDARKYAEWSEQAGEAFRTKYLNDDGTIQESSQTGFALAFSIGLIPDDLRDEAAENFVKEIEKKGWHLATGFVGTQRLLPALTAAGRSDVAYRLLLQETFPSWLFQVKLGATTMWERWDGWTPEKGFQDPGMNSFNHYAFGSVGQWLYGAVAGIETETPGFKTFTVKPVIGEGLTHAEATYKSVRGRIKSGWKKEADGTLKFDIIVPPNTSATVYIPAESPQVVTESGRPVVDRPGGQFINREGGCAVYKVGSGSYHFASKP